MFFMCFSGLLGSLWFFDLWEDPPPLPPEVRARATAALQQAPWGSATVDGDASGDQGERLVGWLVSWVRFVWRVGGWVLQQIVSDLWGFVMRFDDEVS